LLFNSHIFIFLFLPVTLIVFFTIGKRGHHKIAISWLVGASLFFYGWWNPVYLGLILGSMLFNYAIGVGLSNQGREFSKTGLLIFGIAANLGLLGYFKYANFFVNNLNSAIGTDFHLETIILPLAISFFTFQQITYLVDSYKRETQEPDFLRYCLFVTFFPQLIAGPIVHHKEMIPQYMKDRIYSPNQEYLATGVTIFIIGLFKKVVLADGIAVYATPVFNAAGVGEALTFFEAWCGALAYTFQLYFDFSGYSDMAVGLGRMFGIRLPLNFNSPYKAKNIIEFWRCWHMTLSRFLKDYLYIPLGGNRKGAVRRYTNIMITMLLGGLWHGAGWTFVAWGALHGFYLLINHGWHALRQALGHDLKKTSRFGRGTAQLVTFVAVVVGWVFFRAETFTGAIHILSAMLGGNGISFDGMALSNILDDPLLGIGMILVLLTISWYGPNSTEYMLGGTRTTIVWKPTLRHAFLIATMFCVSFFHVKSYSEFLYFQF
jgi:D-alanyl-lipoteichoic acid acyltransferase DltB (MBOAT superfamily)